VDVERTVLGEKKAFSSSFEPPNTSPTPPPPPQPPPPPHRLSEYKNLPLLKPPRTRPPHPAFYSSPFRALINDFLPTSQGSFPSVAVTFPSFNTLRRISSPPRITSLCSQSHPSSKLLRTVFPPQILTFGMDSALIASRTPEKLNLFEHSPPRPFFDFRYQEPLKTSPLFLFLSCFFFFSQVTMMSCEGRGPFQ